jgi:putative exosortase-associated protein (TIGR04073 family)
MTLGGIFIIKQKPFIKNSRGDMNKNWYFSMALCAIWLIVYTPLIQADSFMLSNPVNTASVSPTLSYGEKIADKGLNAFANLTTASLEIPKNVINTMNHSNFFYGLVGGFFKGIFNMLGRTGCGVADLITLPLPTEPIISPAYVWDNFDRDTSYGSVMRLDKASK